MKDKNLQIGTLCTIREEGLTVSHLGMVYKGYWVVTKFHDADYRGPFVRAFSLTHQHHYWWKPDVVNSGG